MSNDCASETEVVGADTTEDVDEAAVELSEDLHDGVFSQPHSRHNSGPSSGTASRHDSGHSGHGGRKKRSFRHSDDVGGTFFKT